MLTLLLDENLPHSVATKLRTVGFDVSTVADLQAGGAGDSEVLRLAAAARRVLVTRDLDFSDILRFPLGTHCGIVVIRLPNNVGIDEIVDILRSRLATLGPDDVRGNLFVITSKLMRVRVHSTHERPS